MACLMTYACVSVVTCQQCFAKYVCLKIYDNYLMTCMCFRCDLFDANLQSSIEQAERVGISNV